jgi:hypothetical protein
MILFTSKLEVNRFFINFAKVETQILVIMKKYSQPTIKSSRIQMRPFAIDIHSGIGNKEEYANTQEMEADQQLPTLSKNIWGE